MHAAERRLPEAASLGEDAEAARRGEGVVDRTGQRASTSTGAPASVSPRRPGRAERSEGRVPARPVGIRFAWSRIEQISFAVTYGLTAIGLCLMLGLCTRLAALGGAAFMCSW